MTILSCDALVIGGGLAGGSAAFALQKRGLRVIMCEASPQLAQKASGNRYGLIMPYITDRQSPFERTYSRGFSFTRELLVSQFRSSGLLHQSGGLQLPSTQRLKRLLDSESTVNAPTPLERLNSKKATQRAGVEIPSCAFYAPEAGFVSPRRLVAEMTKEGTQVLRSERVIELEQTGNRWRAHLTSTRCIESSVTVICGAYESRSLAYASVLPLEPVRGQTLLLAPTATAKLKTLVCFDGYVTPIAGDVNMHLLGAHYRHDDLRSESLESDSEEILRRCRAWLPSLFKRDMAPDSARVCFRTSTIDRLPYVGALLDFAAMRKEAKRFQPGTDVISKVPAVPLPGLYVSVGHGSRGLMSCPMSGEIIARLATDAGLGDLAEVADILSPSRLLSRILVGS